jgi:2-deoxy-D-gluconate 3-dehydrogenase
MESLEDLFSLKGRVAVVTGGNGGIGLGMARGLARAGASIAIVGRNEEKSKAAVDDLKQRGGSAFAVKADVSDYDAVENAINGIAERAGRIDILVNNAGTNVRKRPEALTPEDWHTVMDANISSAFFCSKACFAHMKAAQGGKILNNGSMMSIFGTPLSAAYASSKGAMTQLTKSLATAWAEDNIQVNCFLPGWIDTDMTVLAREVMPDLNDRVLTRTPAKRWGHIDDFQGLAIFLGSPASKFITGATIAVDGGFSVMG